MQSAPRFIDKLVSMTAVHDLELMEFSLLKTLEEFIQSDELLMLKFDRNGIPFYQLKVYKQKYEIIWEDIKIEKEILAGIDIVKKTEQSFFQEPESGRVLTIWLVIRSKSQKVYLATTTSKKLNDLDSHMIKGLLGIYRNFYEVLSESQLDKLTGLSNRKTFDEVINKIYFQKPVNSEFVSIERRAAINDEDVSFWLGMADLDNFKRVNDTWGHLYGDEVLLLTSQLMKGHFRESDYLFRFGGEEFVIIISSTDEKKAHIAFDRFCKALESYTFPQVGKVTISIGVAKMDRSLFTATLLDRADKALYYAKQNGRNQVCFFETLFEKGLVEDTNFTAGEIELF
ncbi:MAG: GGDEF domain-containing protein [Bacteroidetes bacterium]|nr:GGDEF domain-containing protein [Bacteroidota bacterium]